MGNILENEVEILNLLPQVLLDVDEIKALAAVEDPVLTQEWRLLADQLNNQFITTAKLQGIERYERMLNLAVGDNDTLETRRLRVLARFQEQAPYSWRVLNRVLDSLLGRGRYVAVRDIANKVLTIQLELTVGRQFDVVMDLLERITPVNMELRVELRYNQWGTVRTFTWEQLRTRTWNDILQEVL